MWTLVHNVVKGVVNLTKKCILTFLRTIKGLHYVVDDPIKVFIIVWLAPLWCIWNALNFVWEKKYKCGKMLITGVLLCLTYPAKFCCIFVRFLKVFVQVDDNPNSAIDNHNTLFQNLDCDLSDESSKSNMEILLEDSDHCLKEASMECESDVTFNSAQSECDLSEKSEKTEKCDKSEMELEVPEWAEECEDDADAPIWAVKDEFETDATWEMGEGNDCFSQLEITPKNEHTPLDKFPRVLLSDVEFLEEIGHGNFTMIHSISVPSLNHKGGLIHKRPLRPHDFLDQQAFFLDISRNSTFIHTNIVSLIALTCDANSGEVYGAIYESMSEGSLEERVGKGGLSESDSAKVLHNVLEGLEYLHACNFVHVDLHPGNVLLNKCESLSEFNGIIAKITDFNSGFYMENRAGIGNGVMCREEYKAPELQGRESVTEKCDVWAFGKLIGFLIENLSNEWGDWNVEGWESMWEKCLGGVELRPSASCLKIMIEEIINDMDSVDG